MSFVSINTAGKALGVSGAFVAGPAWAIDYLIQRARPFVFSTAPPPALADALDASLDVDCRRARAARAPARRASAASREQLCRGGHRRSPRRDRRSFRSSIGDNERAVAVADALQADGFDVRAIRPPTVPPGTARLRVSVNAGLTDATHRSLRRRRWRPRSGRSDSAPRALRNRHRHRTSARPSSRRRCCAAIASSSAPLLEADSDRHRAGRRHGGSRRLSGCVRERVAGCGHPAAASRVAASRRAAERLDASISRRWSPVAGRTAPAITAGSSRAPAASWFR